MKDNTNKMTAGALQAKASGDRTKYDALEVGHALTEDIMEQLRICAEKHYNLLDIPQFCVVMLLADDSLIHGLMRRKFYAWPFLPKPRPRQSVFLFDKKTDTFKRLWVLPDALTMATASTMHHVSKYYQTMKEWSDAFYEGIEKKNPSIFWNLIRKQSNIKMLSEKEYLDLHASEFVQSEGEEISTLWPETFDFSKIQAYKVTEPIETLSS